RKLKMSTQSIQFRNIAKAVGINRIGYGRRARCLGHHGAPLGLQIGRESREDSGFYGYRGDFFWCLYMNISPVNSDIYTGLLDIIREYPQLFRVAACKR